MLDMPASIGPYEIKSRLGTGGMAETYVGVRHGPGGFAQQVCVKRIRHDLDHDPEFVRQFMAEAAIAARLRHAAIAQIVDFGQSGADYFMAFELIVGMDLRALLEAHPAGLPRELVLYLAIELATALDYAHRGGAPDPQAPIVHRDVSPANTLLSLEGEVKLADFGIARALGDRRHTRTGIVKGKVPYLAPEYARTGRFDARSDLFSLGVLLYESACGERPHDAETDLLTLERAARAEHAALQERVPGFESELSAAIERLLQPDPEQRFQSASDLLETLLRLPATPGARRELGALVAKARPAPAAPSSGSAALPFAPTELSGASLDRGSSAPTRTRVATLPATPEALASESPVPGLSRRRGSVVVLGVAIALAVAVLAVLWLRPNRAPAAGPEVGPVASPESAAPPPSAESPALPLAPDPNSPTGSSGQPEQPRPVVQRARPASTEATAGAQRGRAELEVVVLPYGEVTIDGKRHGTAPVKVTLPAGEHVVTSSGPTGTAERRITLSPGEHRRLVLR